MAALRVSSATIDGEAVVCDGEGVADFDRLRSALARRDGSREPFLYAFDLLELNGADLRPQPWIGRREALASMLRKARDGLALSEHVEGVRGPMIYLAACRMGLEGIVSKRVDRPYRSGRCKDWLKIKNPDAPAASREFER
jgi:bifunctional non-homologous end joining protein LigD